MAYGQAFHVLPVVRTYKQAEQIFNKTAPIRGRKPPQAMYPLGDRRYVDTYSIRKTTEGGAEGEAHYQLVHYKSPVITFYADGRVVVKPHYVSTSTAQYITEVTGRLSASISHGRMIFTFGKKGDSEGVRKYACNRDQQLEFRVTEFTSWSPEWELTKAPAHVHHVLNRAGANNVRARFKSFYTYVKGFMNLRTVPGHTSALIPVQELVDVLGKVGARPTPSIDLTAWNCLLSKPQGDNCNRLIAGVSAWQLWERHNENFVALISAQDTDPLQAEKFYKATMVMVALLYGAWYGQFRRGNYDTANLPSRYEEMKDSIDEVLFKVYSEECIAEVDVEEGKVPNHKYGKYVTRMPLTPDPFSLPPDLLA